MSLKLGVVMDPINEINVNKDTTLAILLAAQRRGWELYYMQQSDLLIRDGEAIANMHAVTVADDPQCWYKVVNTQQCALASLDVILMRNDPPVDKQYLYTTHILALAETAGTLVINKPQALRDFNEKLFISWFPQCTPPTLVSSRAQQLKKFIAEHNDVVLKPLDSMGGTAIFRLCKDDPNINVTIELLTANGQKFIMAQQFIPAIANGDKRIILINGDPVPYALLRRPAPGDIRGNLAAGASDHGVELTPHDRWICQQLKPMLQQHGLIFTGIDVIGEYLTEINITSPTCVRQIDKHFSTNISDLLCEQIASMQNSSLRGT